MAHRLERDGGHGACSLCCYSNIIFPDHTAQAPEGPHIYRKDGWYYMLAAEGELPVERPR